MTKLITKLITLVIARELGGGRGRGCCPPGARLSQGAGWSERERPRSEQMARAEWGAADQRPRRPGQGFWSPVEALPGCRWRTGGHVGHGRSPAMCLGRPGDDGQVGCVGVLVRPGGRDVVASRSAGCGRPGFWPGGWEGGWHPWARWGMRWDKGPVPPQQLAGP